MTRRTVDTVKPTGSDLDRLLDTERRQEAERREKKEEAHLAAAMWEREQAIEREVDDRAAEVRRIAAAEAAGYRAMSPDEIGQLAARGVARLLERAAEGDA